jgi:hypothetical protein
MVLEVWTMFADDYREPIFRMLGSSFVLTVNGIRLVRDSRCHTIKVVDQFLPVDHVRSGGRDLGFKPRHADW